MFDSLTLESFFECLNDEFTVNVDNDASVVFKLVEVSPINSSASAEGAIRSTELNIRRQPFSLLFRGPVGEPLIQRMYLFDHGRLGTIDGLFITPVAEDDKGVYYEAIFD